VSAADACHRAGAALTSGDTARARHWLDTALLRADAKPDVRSYRNIARLRARLGEPDHACVALARGFEGLLRTDATAGAWQLLALAWLARGDVDAALDALAHGRAHAQSTSELAGLAQAAAAAGDHTAHDLLAAAAEARATSTTDWIALEQWERALTAVATVDDALVLASRCHVELRVRAIEAGARFAVTVEDWLALARTPAGSDAYLARARVAASTVSERARVESALAWHGSYAYEGAQWSSPSALLRRPTALLDRLCAALSADDVAALIARSAEDAADAASIEEIWRTATVPHPMRSRRVRGLEIERWTEHDVDDVARAFACTALCLGSVGYRSSAEGHESTLAVLLESCTRLGDDVMDELGAFLAALEPWHRDTIYGSFIELARLLAIAWHDPDDPEHLAGLARLGERVVLESLFERTVFGQRREMWQSLASRILAGSGAAITDAYRALLA
jgi:hypothetical protein